MDPPATEKRYFPAWLYKNALLYLSYKKNEQAKQFCEYGCIIYSVWDYPHEQRSLLYLCHEVQHAEIIRRGNKVNTVLHLTNLSPLYKIVLLHTIS